MIEPCGRAGGDLNFYAYVGDNPLMGVDHSGTDPQNPFTGQPNSTLHCHVDAHWDRRENFIGVAVVGGPLVYMGLVETGAAAVLENAVEILSKYAITAGYSGVQSATKAGKAAMNWARMNLGQVEFASDFIEAAVPGIPEASWGGAAGSALNYFIGWSENTGKKGKEY